MNRLLFLILAGFFLLPTASLAMNHEGLNENQAHCYATAMIGMDSVINARLGVPPEHALVLTRVHNADEGTEQYDSSVLNVILAAYLWQATPHSYAINVFYDCARNMTYQRQTMAD